MSQSSNIYGLSVGQIAIIKMFTNHALATKLMSMGILPGTKIKLVRTAPFGGACYVKANHHTLALRKTEAATIEIELAESNIK